MKMKHLKNINESINNQKLTILNGDDWEGLYYNGKLINEGHRINWIYALKKIGFKINSEYLTDEEW